MPASDRGRCQRCCGCIFSLGVTALFLWLSLRTSKPICSIQDFYVPALDKSANSTANTSISFDLKLDNKNRDKGIYYSSLNLTFYYGSDPVANQTFPKFYQGFNKKARRRAAVETRGFFGPGQNGSDQVLRVGLVTSVRFKIIFWKTKRHKLVVGAEVKVNEFGKKEYEKGIRLRSGAPEPRCYPALPFGIIVYILLNLVFSI
ncbi:late embryogenesis abundant (LEA) hydroxyproline-rich glycoprotein family [Actinidia rufa]|uniref:Late embryogenesis abundant (LEA) hydroxyproline-rich glycoprotein family n=1 Tax=Actinidia rufa TaxID=165716 RepID=A0A7J0G6W9_9ERIC|nr:late embryogenesis abundant (LEA) hydroxyproline-rich glycoprotein family [Actinidia rufa]